jgi:mono/diheme cytochrome c family protein
MMNRAERRLPSLKGLEARTLRLARSIAVGVISAVLLAGAGDSMADAAHAQGDAARGRTLFVSTGCVVCHAINEVGGTSAPPLDPEAASGDVDALDFVARMWRGAEAMLFMQQQELGVQIDFTGQELADIIAFVHDPKERRKFSEQALAQGDPEAGRDIVRSWCTACHVVDLEGTGADAGPALPALLAGKQRSADEIRGWLADPHPPMPNLNLSRQEIDDILAYLESLTGD